MTHRGTDEPESPEPRSQFTDTLGGGCRSLFVEAGWECLDLFGWILFLLLLVARFVVDAVVITLAFTLADIFHKYIVAHPPDGLNGLGMKVLELVSLVGLTVPVIFGVWAHLQRSREDFLGKLDDWRSHRRSRQSRHAPPLQMPRPKDEEPKLIPSRPSALLGDGTPFEPSAPETSEERPSIETTHDSTLDLPSAPLADGSPPIPSE